VKHLIDAFATILDDRRTQNKNRVEELKRASAACAVAGLASLLQLLAVFAAIVVK